MPWVVVGRIVGHSTPGTTLRYLGAMLTQQRGALKHLGKTPSRKRRRRAGG